MAWSQGDEQTKVNEIERWDHAVFKPNRIPTPSYFEHETFDQQRKRLMNKARPLVSEELQKVRTDDIFGTSLDHVAQQYFESAASEAVRPTKVPKGELKEVISYDQAGRPSYSYFGSPRAWMDNFATPKKYLVGIRSNLSFQKV